MERKARRSAVCCDQEVGGPTWGEQSESGHTFGPGFLI